MDPRYFHVCELVLVNIYIWELKSLLQLWLLCHFVLGEIKIELIFLKKYSVILYSLEVIKSI